MTVELAEDAMQKKAVLYDKGGDKHYDYISAWIKATRGSDVDASLYYLAVMLEGGEDPRFIARRMIVLASEDIGNADPQALQVGRRRGAGRRARRHARVRAQPQPGGGLPGARAEVERELRPRSRARVRTCASRAPSRRPPYLQDAHYPGARSSAAESDTSIRTTCPTGVSDQPLLPEGLEDRRYYEPTERGFETKLRERLTRLRKSGANRAH